MADRIECIAETVGETFSSFMFSLFDAHGYNKEQVIQLFEEKHLSIERFDTGPDEVITSVFLDGQILFRVKETWSLDFSLLKVKCVFEEVTI